MGDAKLTFEPEVRTLAHPEPQTLLAARNQVLKQPALKELFLQAKQEEWASEKLAEHLCAALEADVESSTEMLSQVAQYLADEFFQFGDKVLLIHPETGRAILQVTDEDFYQPASVPRSGGTMATPLPRLNPELEARLVEWTFERSREQQAVNVLASRLPQDVEIRPDDRRFLPVTRKGRKQIAADLFDQLPTLLPEALQGQLREFLGHFEFRETVPPHLVTRTVSCEASVSTKLMDYRTFNLRYDHATTLAARIAADWGRSLVNSIASLVDFETLGFCDFQPGDFTWASDPATALVLGKTFAPLRVTPIQGCRTTGVRDQAGVIALTLGSFGLQGQEYHDKWFISARMVCTVGIDRSHVRAFELEDVPVVLTAELVS